MQTDFQHSKLILITLRLGENATSQLLQLRKRHWKRNHRWEMVLNARRNWSVAIFSRLILRVFLSVNWKGWKVEIVKDWRKTQLLIFRNLLEYRVVNHRSLQAIHRLAWLMNRKQKTWLKRICICTCTWC